MEGKVDITDVVGPFGKWQLLICINLWMLMMVGPMHNFIITFQAPRVNHWCAMPRDLEEANVTLDQWMEMGIPREEDGLYSRCFRFDSWNASETNRTRISCHRWDFEDSVHTATIVQKFDLVCDREWMISMLKSVYMLGYFFSGLMSGLGDRFGRRPTILAFLATFLVSSLITAYSTCYEMMVILRLFQAIGCSGAVNTAHVLMIEILGPQQRVACTYLRSGSWTLGMLILAGIAYVIRDWFWLQITVSLPLCILAITFWWMVPESPRWLLTKGYKEKAMAELKKATLRNGLEAVGLESSWRRICSCVEHPKEVKHHNCFDLFRTDEMRKITLTLYFSWIVTIFIYYGITYNTNSLSGDMYVNFVATTAAEIPGLVVFFIVSSCIGRRKSFFLSQVLCGSALLLTIAVPRDHPWLVTALVIVGKSFTLAAITDLFVITIEVFPTVVRNLGLGSCSTLSRVGACISPFVVQLGNIKGVTVSHILFGALALASGMMILILPETHEMHIPDTIEEARKLGRKKSFHAGVNSNKTQQSQEEHIVINENRNIFANNSSTVET